MDQEEEQEVAAVQEEAAAPVVEEPAAVAEAAEVPARDAAPLRGVIPRGYYQPNEVNNPNPVPGLANYAGEGITTLKASGHQSPH